MVEEMAKALGKRVLEEALNDKDTVIYFYLKGVEYRLELKKC